MWPEYLRPLRSTSPLAVPSLSTFSSFCGCFENVLSRSRTRIVVSAKACEPRSIKASTTPATARRCPAAFCPARSEAKAEGLRDPDTLFPPQDPEDERQHNAEQDAGCQGEVEG